MTDATDKPNTFTLDEHEVDIRPGETIFRAARRVGIKLPHLCYSPKPGYRPDGNCRVCMVEVEGERVLAASCIRTPTPGMKVKTQTDRAKTARRMVVELLLTDQPPKDVAHRRHGLGNPPQCPANDPLLGCAVHARNDRACPRYGQCEGRELRFQIRSARCEHVA